MTKEEILGLGLQEKENYTFDDFREIIAVLRDPENGCPWDRVQTHDSLRGCFQDEVNEVYGGMDQLDETGDASNLCEELGDVLMHIVLQARIAEQEGLFTMDDVISGISRKMIRRHPHEQGRLFRQRHFRGAFLYRCGIRRRTDPQIPLQA